MTEMMHITAANVNESPFAIVLAHPLDTNTKTLEFIFDGGYVSRRYDLRIVMVDFRMVFMGSVTASGAINETTPINMWIIAEDLRSIQSKICVLSHD